MTDQKALLKDFTSHPVTAYINSLTSPNSKRTMLSALKTVIGVAIDDDPRDVDPLQVYEFNWPSLSPSKLKALSSRLLEKGYSRAHAAKCLAAVRGVLGACFDEDLIGAKEFMKLERVKGISVRRNHKAGRRLTEGEIQALARACADDPRPTGARDDAIIGIGYTQGPRISEVSRLKLSDYDPRTGDLVIRRAKGGKTRTIRAANSAKDSLDEWIRIRGDQPGRLFLEVDKASHVVRDPRSYKRNGKNVVNNPGMTTAAITKMLKARAADAGVKPFTFHDLRRTFLTNGWSIGIPGTQLQTIAGHASIETTAAYDRGDLEEALKAGERLHYPSMRHQA